MPEYNVPLEDIIEYNKDNDVIQYMKNIRADIEVKDWCSLGEVHDATRLAEHKIQQQAEEIERLKKGFLTPLQQKQLLWIAWELHQSVAEVAMHMAQDLGNIDSFTDYYTPRLRTANKELMFLVSLETNVIPVFLQLGKTMPLSEEE